MLHNSEDKGRLQNIFWFKIVQIKRNFFLEDVTLFKYFPDYHSVLSMKSYNEPNKENSFLVVNEQ